MSKSPILFPERKDSALQGITGRWATKNYSPIGPATSLVSPAVPGGELTTSPGASTMENYRHMRSGNFLYAFDIVWRRFRCSREKNVDQSMYAR